MNDCTEFIKILGIIQIIVGLVYMYFCKVGGFIVLVFGTILLVKWHLFTKSSSPVQQSLRQNSSQEPSEMIDDTVERANGIKMTLGEDINNPEIMSYVYNRLIENNPDKVFEINKVFNYLASEQGFGAGVRKKF